MQRLPANTYKQLPLDLRRSFSSYLNALNLLNHCKTHCSWTFTNLISIQILPMCFRIVTLLEACVIALRLYQYYLLSLRLSPFVFGRLNKTFFHSHASSVTHHSKGSSHLYSLQKLVTLWRSGLDFNQRINRVATGAIKHSGTRPYMAHRRGLEPLAFCVTGRRSNQLI